MTDTNNINGVLNLNKPEGKTSHDMVYFARRLFGIKKIGHAGTLDPMASGVLPVLAGNATKLSELLLERGKSYKTVLKLGISTDTMDITGNITKRAGNAPLPGFDEVKKAAGSFVGEIEQVPPVYSAVKINGRKLYEYARNGEQIKAGPRKVNIYSILCEKSGEPGEYILDIACSKGTYIRSLCHDIGEKLACGGAMAGLVRTKSGNFDISNSYTPETLEAYKKEKGGQYLTSLLVSCEDILKGFTDKQIYLSGFYSKLAKNGAEIYLYKIERETPAVKNFCCGEKIMMYDQNGLLFALGKIGEYEGGLACKPEVFV